MSINEKSREIHLPNEKKKKKSPEEKLKRVPRKLTLEIAPQLGEPIFHVLLRLSELLLGDGQGFRSRQFQIQIKRRHHLSLFSIDDWTRYDETILIAGRPQYNCDLIYIAREGGLLLSTISIQSLTAQSPIGT